MTGLRAERDNQTMRTAETLVSLEHKDGPGRVTRVSLGRPRASGNRASEERAGRALEACVGSQPVAESYCSRRSLRFWTKLAFRFCAFLRTSRFMMRNGPWTGRST